MKFARRLQQAEAAALRVQEDDDEGGSSQLMSAMQQLMKTKVRSLCSRCAQASMQYASRTSHHTSHIAPTI
jgi:heme O synthase-like polyprenyltransferase